MALGSVAGYLGIGVETAVKAGEGASALGVTADSIVAPTEDAMRYPVDEIPDPSADSSGIVRTNKPTDEDNSKLEVSRNYQEAQRKVRNAYGLMDVSSVKLLFMDSAGSDISKAIEQGKYTAEEVENMMNERDIQIFPNKRYLVPAKIQEINDKAFWKNLETKYGTSFVTPSDLQKYLNKSPYFGTMQEKCWADEIVDNLSELGIMSERGLDTYYGTGEESDNLFVKNVIGRRDAAIAEAQEQNELGVARYKAQQWFARRAQTEFDVNSYSYSMSISNTYLENEFSRRCFDGAIAMALVVPLWNRFVDRTFQYPAEQVVSTTAISNLITLRNEYGNMSTIYRVKSATPIPASYTSHSPGSWILTTSVSYPMYLQVNLQALYDVYETTMINLIGEQLYRASKLTKSQSHTSKGYTSHSLTLTIYRDYENITSQEKVNITNIIDANLRVELQKYVPEGDSYQNDEVTTTTTTTTPTHNNPAVYPQLLGGGPSAGYSPKLVLLSEGGADRAQSRFMLRTGWNNALDNRNTTSFASVNNTGNKNFVRDSSNFIKYRKLRAINQNYNDLKK